ncbi:MAG: ABC transporter permease [Candidatus Pacebacteria bacterium]|nr:ABC transporter permease [Candidatus Paceibacterota bacterium]
MIKLKRHCFLVVLATIMLAGLSAPAQDDASKLKSELAAFIAPLGSRAPGSAGNLALEDKVAKRFADSGFAHGAIRFTAPSFIPGETTIQLENGPTVRLRPMHPSLTRPGNFRERTFQSPLIYFGQAEVADLAALEGFDLNDSIAVLEFDCGGAWQRLARFGVRGFIFLGGDMLSNREAQQKVTNTEVPVPRFFVDAEAADDLRSRLTQNDKRQPVMATINAVPSAWKNRGLRNLWAFIPGSDPDLEKDVVVVTAPMDANCVVPELAFGGQHGANLFLLLKLLEEFKQTPPARSVMLVALNGHTYGHFGERMLAWHLMAPPPKVERMRALLADQIRTEKVYLDFYQMIDFSEPVDEIERKLIDLRTLEDRSTGRLLKLKDPVVAYSKRDVNLTKAALLRVQEAELSDAEKKEQQKSFQKHLDKYVRILTLFNKVGIQTNFSELNPDEVAVLKDYIKTIRTNYETWLAKNREALDIDTANGAVRKVLQGRHVSFLISLELMWNGSKIGFYGNAGARFGTNTVRIARTVDSEGHIFLDTLTNYAGLSQDYYFQNTQAPNSGGLRKYYSAWVPAVALRTAFSDPRRMFTPDDVVEALDADILHRQFTFTTAFFRHLLADPLVTMSGELSRPSAELIWSLNIKTFKFDEFSASVVPQLPVPNTMFILYPYVAESSDTSTHVSFAEPDTINRVFVKTDERASEILYGLEGNKGSRVTKAYRLDDTLAGVDHVIDAGEAEAKASSNIPVTTSRTLALFKCYELPVRNREDPSRVSHVPITSGGYYILDAAQDSAPRKYGLAGMSSALSSKRMPEHLSGPAAVYLEPGSRVKILTEFKRTALNASDEYPEGKGFRSPEELGADFFYTAAKDMKTLNRYRLENLQGVSNQLVDDYLAKGRQHLESTHAADLENRHLDYLKSLYQALGSEVKAYAQISGITNDMLKAIVFYMALLLPFCFFIEKLLFKFVKLEIQLGVFGVLFVLTFLLFRMIHPAFKVATAPEAIFIGFVMGVLGLFVIMILHGRFEGEMQLLFMTYSGVDSSEVGYSTVGQKAMLIGVNNMKRRRIRTSLTTATIVLVTFTMLAFSSVSKRMSPTIIPVTRTTPYKGVYYQWPGSLRMDERTLSVLKELFTGTAAETVVRRWLIPPPATGNTLPYPFPLESSKGSVLQLDAVLGISTREDGFLGPIAILPGGRFFSSDNASEAVLPVTAADALGLTQDDVGSADLIFRGHRLKLVGLVDNERFRALRELNNRPILPIKEIQKGALSGTQKVASGKVDPSAVRETGIFYADMSSLLILPVETARSFGAQPFSISARLSDDTSLWDTVDMLLTATSAKFYIGSPRPFAVGAEGKRKTNAGSYYIGSGAKTSIGGLSRLIIPLLIAGTIILNTMLGAVYERKSEIAVYNAIGLNPTHIGLFFLAEAFVYSVIGSVGGYLIGQGLTLGLTKFNLVPGLNLNFSSLSVVYVILFTIGVVLLSTIYPAIAATRAAVPSGKHRWSMPAVEGNQMNVTFPFIYQPPLAPAVIAYLDHYFSRFTEASVGELIATFETLSKDQDKQGRPRYTIVYTIALAPFDLGVTQNATLQARYDDVVQSYRVHLRLDRLSGQDSNWVTTNKPFLEKLRQHLLHWRNLDEMAHENYRQDGDALFERGTPLSE